MSAGGRGVTRRSFLKGAAGTGIVAGNIGLLSEIAGGTSNSISAENALTGSPETEWTDSAATTIVGYTSPLSVAPGDTVTFRVDTISTHYRIRVYRLGWYQGNGARRVGEITKTLATAATQPAPQIDTATGLKDYGTWTPTATWTVPATAVSGVYYALFERLDTTNESSFSLFVVRRPTGSDLLVQTSDSTWHAYNTYGGNSLYQGNPVGRAYKVSYNRPFEGLSGENGFFAAEYPLLRFLERNGYDVAYCTGLDTATDPNLLLNRKVFISSGHDEYWTGPQRANVEAARDAGVSLIFMSGNEVFWKTRLESSIDGTNTPNRTLVCYKETLDNAKTDPSPEWTGTWRDPRFSPPSNGGRPENGLTGQLFRCINPQGNPDFAIKVPFEYAALRFWRNTAIASLTAGQVQTLTANTLGYEWDTDVDNGFRPAGLIRLSSTSATAQQVLIDYGGTYQPATATHNLTMYRASSGALVFGTGTVQWAYGLDAFHTTDDPTPVDPIIKQATVNILADMGTQPVTLEAGLVVASKSTDTLAPTSTITAPAAGDSLVVGSPVTVTGTASDTGGVVAGVEVSTDGGTTWHPVTGTTSWSYSFVPRVLGPLTIKSRATDDSCNMETPGTGCAVQVVSRPYPVSIFIPSDVPGTTSTNDAGPLEVGVKFKADGGGFVTGVKFYKGAGNTGTHVGHLWSASGLLLATGTFANETTSGWQTVSFDPVAITGNTTYIASVYMPAGHYASDVGFFNTAYELPPLRALANNEDGPNGVYHAGGIGFPVATFGATNYWIDVVVSGDNNAAPTVIDTSPAAGLQSVSCSTTAVATFSESLTASSLVMELRDETGAAVPATVVYDATFRLATLTPAAALTPLTQYTANVVSATDSGGTPMAAPFSWTFTTVGPVGSTPASIWDTSATPAVLASTDTSAVELGVKFTADVDGTITGLRYFKSAGSPGTALGHLWDAAGTLLGSVTFSPTTVSGWQQANLATPVAVTANTVYVASYYLPNGVYPYTAGQFSSTGVDSGVLHVAATGPAGGNGVYRYGASAFPNTSASGTNYWADVVFVKKIDTSTPSVTTVEPAPNLISVALATGVKATFSKPIDPSTLQFTLQDSGNATVASTVTYDAGSLTATLTPSAALVRSQTYTATVTASDLGGRPMAAPYSWSFATVTPAGTTPTTLWDTSAVPAVPVVNDSGSVELGLRFTTSTAGVVTGIRFYKGASNTGAHVGHLWSTTGTLLGTVDFTTETASGWQQAYFTTPIAVSAGGTYLASYFAPASHYAADSGYFANSVSQGALSAPADTTGAHNGLYVYGTGGFPTGSWNATNYWVDVIFEDSAAPGVSSESPAPGAIGVAPNVPVTATFNEAVQPGTIVFELRDSGGALVAGSTTYDSATLTATFTPSAPLGSLATYTASVSGARDLQGNAMTAPVSWSFTTFETGLWSVWPSAVPAHPTTADPSAVELGVKFVTSAPGVVRGVRFYKGAGNTGAHVGNLWTTSGTLLATVTFSNESDTGWQYAAFASPVRLTPGTPYVASYFAPSGNYASDGGYFSTSGVTNGPLTALANGASGGNGVYLYATSGGYPSNTYAASNYWVDVLFKAD